MYPQRQVAIIMSAAIESATGLLIDATPWDTGTFYGQVASQLGLDSDSSRSRVYHEHTLPAPFYRSYLMEYITTCFSSSGDYLRGRRNSRADPLRVMAICPDDLLVRVFEAHISPSVNFNPEQIVAIFLPRPRMLTRDLREKVVPELRRAGIPVEYYGQRRPRPTETNPTPADLQRHVTRWICDRVGVD